MSINLFEMKNKELIEYARRIRKGEEFSKLNTLVTVLCIRLEEADLRYEKLREQG